jgi:hypothetical protein
MVATDDRLFSSPLASRLAGIDLSPRAGTPGLRHWFHCAALGAVGGTLGCIAFPRSGILAGGTGPRSRARGAIGGARFAFGAVGMDVLDTFGETLKALLRGPDGALGGGGVFGRENPGPEAVN